MPLSVTLKDPSPVLADWLLLFEVVLALTGVVGRLKLATQDGHCAKAALSEKAAVNVEKIRAVRKNEALAANMVRIFLSDTYKIREMQILN
jgi:hypothetical protein